MQKCAFALKGQHHTYKAANNLFSIDLTRLGHGSKVPILRTNINELRSHFFETPAPLPMDVWVAVSDPDDVVAELATNKATRISPPEILYAFLDAVARDVQNEDEERCKVWRDAIVSAPFKFELIASEDDRHIATMQAREDMTKRHNTMRWSPIQKMYDIIGCMERKPGLSSAAKVAEYYRRVKFGDSDDAISQEFVDCALTVNRRLMSIPTCKAPRPRNART